MRKKLITALCIILLCLPFSCSFLPKNIDVHGTLDLAIKVTADNWGKAVAKVLKKALIKNSDKIDMIDFEAEIYDVNYGQEVQTFLISIRSEMTNHLNPAEYLAQASEFLYHLGSIEPFDISFEFDMRFLKEKEFAFPELYFDVPGFLSGVPLPPTPIDIPISSMDLSPGIDSTFLHASIADGDMEIIVEVENENGAILDKNAFDIKYNINLVQDIVSPYSGLSCSIGPLNIMSLNGQHINGGKININSSSIEITPRPGSITLPSDELKIKIKVKINIRKLKEIDLNFLSITNVLNDHQIEPVSLDDVSPYVNYILYQEKGIGLRFNFTEMIDGLAMSIESNALSFDPGFQNLTKGKDILFSNKNNGTIWLSGPLPSFSNVAEFPPFTPGVSNNFDFKLKLKPSGSDENVLHIEPAEGITPDILKIKGTAEFFQNWKEAQLNLDNIIKSAPGMVGTGIYTKRIPGEDEDPINLSMLSYYISGFSFSEIKSEFHINGPKGVVSNLNVGENIKLSLWAEYWGKEITDNYNREDIYIEESLILEETPVSLNDRDFDARGSYKKSSLPPNGKHFEFSKIMEAQPNNLVFNTRMEIPSTITVTHDIFQREDSIIDSKITVTIFIMLPLKLTVTGNAPGTIKFPDMFDGANDLFGRDNLNEDSVFKSLGIEHLKFSIDFTGAFFNGGKFFIEKEGEELLFPNGINLSGKRMELYISGSDLDIIKNNLITPDLRLIFNSPNSMLNVPRNIGLNNFKFEARGKFELSEL
jgi:hypothetical protein